MLRSIQHPHIRPRVLSNQVSTSGVAATLDIGLGYSTTASASSVATLTRNMPVIRPGIVLGSVGSTLSAGSYFVYNTDPAAASVVCKTLDAAGAAKDGTFDILSIDYHNESTDRVAPLQTFKASSNGVRWIVARITSAGVASVGGSKFSSVSKASSIYTLTFANAFARTPLVFPVPIASGQKSIQVTAKSASAVSIATYSSAEAAEDNSFYVLIAGWDRKDDTYGAWRAIQIAQIKPRVEVFRVTNSGLAAIALGGADASVVRNGAGDCTLTWTKAFSREPIIIPVAKANRAQVGATATTTAGQILTFNATGTATDDDFCALVIGFDRADEI